MTYSGIAFLPSFILVSALAAVPLSGPPLPLDPALSAIAPAECVWYGSSAGVAEADPRSSNQTEQLFAEPEVRYFAEQLQQQLQSALNRFAGAGPGERVLSTAIPTLIRAAIRRPVAAFVEDFRITDDGAEVQAGLMLNAGEQRAEIQTAIDQLVELAQNDSGIVIGSIDQDGESWYIFRASMQTPEIRWGWHDDYFILAVGDGTAETIRERMSGTAPAWLDDIRNSAAVPRESSLVYLNIERLFDCLRPELEREGIWTVVEKLQLTSLQSLHGIAGFDEDGCTAAHADRHRRAASGSTVAAGLQTAVGQRSENDPPRGDLRRRRADRS